MRAAVVILNWNKAELTRNCLQSAQAATSAYVDWIVVDNGSKEPIADLGPGVTLLCNTENLGFAGGVNTGLRHAFSLGIDHVWLLNNDAEPLPGALDLLLEVARREPKVGLASAVILNSDDDDAVEFYAGTWDSGSSNMTTDPATHQRWLAERPGQTWLMGTALLVSRALVEKIGYFDEKLFAYWEDNDISYRSAAAGFQNIVVPDAFVRHQSGHRVEKPEGRPPYYYYYMARNEILFLRKISAGLRPLYWATRRQLRLFGRLGKLKAQKQALRKGLIDGALGRGGRYPT